MNRITKLKAKNQMEINRINLIRNLRKKIKYNYWLAVGVVVETISRN